MRDSPVESEASVRTPRRVLVVEHEKHMAASVGVLLHGCGYDVEIARDGCEGLEKLNQEDYPVVITGLSPGDIDACRFMDALEARPHSAFIVISTDSSTEATIDALRHGAKDYLLSPFDFEILKVSVEKAFAKVDAERFRDDMLSMITHDIKIPLTSILGYSSLVFDKKSGEQHPRAREFMLTINSNGRKILALIDNFLTTCKIDSGHLTIFFEQVHLEYLFEDLVSMFSGDLERQQLKLELDLPEQMPILAGDETLLFRALENMLSNACKFSSPGGSIRVKVETLDEINSPLNQPAAAIHVSNAGPGIAAEDLGTIFNKYCRGRTTTGVDGNGIGSYVLKSVVMAHGGSVFVSSVPNELTTFSVHLPLKHP